jgi:hypothetical protein
MALVRTNVSEERIASIIRVTRIGGHYEQHQQYLAPEACCQLWLLVTANVPSADSCHPGDGSDMFL